MTTPPSVSSRVAAELRAAVARKQITHAAIAAQLDRHQVWVTRRLGGQVSVTVEELVSLCEVLGIDPMPLLDQALNPAPAPVAATP